MTTMSKTYQHMKCEVKHNGDLGMSHLWLNGVGSYEKVSCCFFWKYAKKKCWSSEEYPFRSSHDHRFWSL